MRRRPTAGRSGAHRRSVSRGSNRRSWRTRASARADTRNRGNIRCSTRSRPGLERSAMSSPRTITRQWASPTAATRIHWRASAICSINWKNAMAGGSNRKSSWSCHVSHCRRIGQCENYRAAGGGAFCSEEPWCPSRTCCCSTNRPIISTSRPYAGWKIFFAGLPAHCSSSHTIAPFSETWRPESWNWIAAA